MIELIIVLIFVLLIFGLFFHFFNKNKSLKGGEYIVARLLGTNKKSSPTISQIIMLDQDIMTLFGHILHGNSSNNDLFKIINDKSSKFLLSHGTYNFNKSVYKIPNCYNNKHISDANIDSIGILIDNDITSLMSGCEFHPDKFRIEENEYYTIYGPYINKINDEITMYKDTTKKLFYLKSVDDASQYNFIRTEFNKRSEIKQPTVFCFIEFVYDDIINVNNAYFNIHRKTKEIINKIIKIASSKVGIYMFIYRCIVKNNGDVMFDINDGEMFNEKPVIYGRKDDGTRYAISAGMKTIYSYIHDDVLSYNNLISKLDNKQAFAIQNISQPFNQIMIPTTIDEFSYDEYITFFDKNDLNYRIQIEHSEGFGSHKSNIIEFILRTMKPFITDQMNDKDYELIDIIHNRLHYQMKDNKFIYSLEDESKSLNETLIYKSFAPYTHLL